MKRFFFITALVAILFSVGAPSASAYVNVLRPDPDKDHCPRQWEDWIDCPWWLVE